MRDAQVPPDDSSNVVIDYDSLTEEEKLRIDVISALVEPCDRATYGARLKESAAKLGKSVRSVQRLVQKWKRDGAAGLLEKRRSDRGRHRIGSQWEAFILDTFEKGNLGSKCMSRAQVYEHVRARASKLKIECPSHMTVYRILQTQLDKQETKNNVRSVGWGRRSQRVVKTKDGIHLEVDYSNQIWQCDHTRADILLVDRFGELLGRPWLTIVVDTYSRCLMGFHLGFDAPSSQVTALALRHAILLKQYGSEYKLTTEWDTYGVPEILFTDSGDDFKSNHLARIASELGITLKLRDRPSEGGIVERIFGTINTEFFSTIEGYTGSNVLQRSKKAEREAKLTLKDLEQLLVRYFVDRYNQKLSVGAQQSRIERWRGCLTAEPRLLVQRDLDLCLLQSGNAKVYRGGYIKFANLVYKGENLQGYEGERVIKRYDPTDISQILIYQQRDSSTVFLCRATALNLEAETLSLEEAKSLSRRLRKAKKTINNRAILDELLNRQAEVKTKPTRKERKKAQKLRQETLIPKDLGETEVKEDEWSGNEEPPPSQVLESDGMSDLPLFQEPVDVNPGEAEPSEAPETNQIVETSDSELPSVQVFEYDDLGELSF
ncbi:MAG: Mu transposase C-terminal domain-containing protein [Cyanobacteria bacterium P01_G01_bin.4]